MVASRATRPSSCLLLLPDLGHLQALLTFLLCSGPSHNRNGCLVPAVSFSFIWRIRSQKKQETIMLHCPGSFAALRGEKMYFSRHRQVVTAVLLSLCHLLNTRSSHMSQRISLLRQLEKVRVLCL